jgi:CRISPR/Cas system CSM-associated protein Csm3 (group 7 of RAMP superfamily)
MKDKENRWNKITRMQAKYAEYTNTGENKTRGFGEVRLSDL